MAKNYSFSEAVEIIAKGTDLVSIQDLGRRYPLLATMVAKVTAKAGDDFAILAGFIPEHVSANKVNSNIKALIAGETDEDGEDTEETTEKTETKKTEKAAEKSEKTPAKSTDSDYASKSGDALIALCKERGLDWKKKKKAELIETLEAADKGGKGKAKAAPAKEETTEDDWDDAEEVNPYEGKSAMDLFKMCKERKIKTEPKQKAAVYVELLVKADAAEAKETEEDDWEEEETKPAKEEKKSGKASKPAKPAKEEEDDWDL